MIKIKFITRTLIFVTLVLLLSSNTNVITENKIISIEKNQSNSNISGLYEFQTSWLQSTVNFKSDGTFEMSYTIGEKHETTGTWSISKDTLILKNNDKFPANKKWLIKNEKLYPILKSSKEYDMNFFYISKKQPNEEINCNVLKDCKLKFFDTDDNSTYIIIKNNIHIEFPNGGKDYIKSKLEWINECEYNATIIELTTKYSPFKIGDKLNVKFEKIENNTVHYTASFDGEIISGKFKIMN